MDLAVPRLQHQNIFPHENVLIHFAAGDGLWEITQTGKCCRTLPHYSFYKWVAAVCPQGASMDLAPLSHSDAISHIDSLVLRCCFILLHLDTTPLPSAFSEPPFSDACLFLEAEQTLFPAMSLLGADWKAWHSNISLEDLSHKKAKLNDYQNISMTFTSFYFFSLRVWIFQGWRCVSKTAWVPHAWNQWLFDQDGAESNSLPRKMAFCPKCLCMSVSVQISVCFPFP